MRTGTPYSDPPRHASDPTLVKQYVEEGRRALPQHLPPGTPRSASRAPCPSRSAPEHRLSRHPALPTKRSAHRHRLCRPETSPKKTEPEKTETAKPDAVSISTYPDTHADYAEAAFDAGCHVFIEKPLAETVAGAERILRREIDANRHAELLGNLKNELR